MGKAAYASVKYVQVNCVMQSAGLDAEMGHVLCGGLQLNCHGLTEMLLGERVEYAWLMQLDVHQVTGVVSTSQVCRALLEW